MLMLHYITKEFSFAVFLFQIAQNKLTCPKPADLVTLIYEILNEKVSVQ